MFVTILTAVLVFGVLIAIHEAGHLLAAKSVGVTVHEFAIGMGPKLFSFTKGETRYSLRCLPIGGFCQLEGEDTASDDPGALCNKSVGARFLVMVAGATMNIILGFLLYVVLSGVVGGPTVATNIVESVLPDSPAAVAGLQSGDRVISINGNRVHRPNEVQFELWKTNGAETEVKIKRGEETKTFFITPELVEEDGASYFRLGYYWATAEKNLWRIIASAWHQLTFNMEMVFYSFGQMVTGQVSLDQISGPVGIVDQIGQSAQGGFWSLLSFVAFITINLGVFNLFPFPALDGGRILFLLIEVIRRKPLDSEKEGWVHFVGLACLLLLMLIVTWSDLSKLNLWDKWMQWFGGGA